MQRSIVNSRSLAAAAILLVAAGAAAWVYFGRTPPKEPAGPPPIVPLSPTPYLNTGPDATYVGSAACIRCHKDEHKSYLRTGMSRSTAVVDPAKEPADATFDHASSGRRYKVERRGEQLWHRELLAGDGKKEIVLAEFPMKYAVGSGRFGKTYLAEADGFVFESPISYYTTRSAWGLSPGYENNNVGFERPTSSGCLYCHVGRSETEPGSMQRHRVIEPVIGCERCHGPGSLHTAARERRDPIEPSSHDLTIVNPRRLSRDLAESVCQQCHLGPELTVPARGRKPTDFRPGLPLSDFAIGFGHVDAGQMTVTGHVEQLHQSKCYQKSETLTCITCHDPHGFPEPKNHVAYFRAKCQECHSEKSCKVDPKVLHAQSPDNDCAKCHMPHGEVDIPHLAFSHHRIGVHTATTSKSPPREPEARHGSEAVESFHDLSRYGDLDRARLLGLAYGKAGARLEMSGTIEAYNRRAEELLSDVWQKGLRDGAVAAALARARFWLAMREGSPEPPDLKALCEPALADPDLPGKDRCDVQYFLAQSEGRRGRFAEAAEYLRQNTKLRRNAVDWTFLARCETGQSHADEALRLLEHAATISPADERLRRQLIDICERKGDRERAEYHRQRLIKR